MSEHDDHGSSRMPARRRLGVGLLAIVAILGASLALTLMAGGGSSEAIVRDPHGGSIAKSELDRILLATERATVATPRAELEARGAKLFNSAAMAKPGESCASCHVIGGGVNAALGVITHPNEPGDFRGLRDAPSLWDVALTAPYNWIGGNATLEAQAATAITTHFKNEAADASAENVAALVAFLRTIRAPVTRHDQGRLTPQELAGEEIFVGKGGCIACHGGPQFTDNQIHDTDVPQNDSANAALGGAANDPGSPAVPQGFNTPHLRDIRNTAPYMHNGVLDTLEQVVAFYDQNAITGGPLRLTATEKAELVAYLKTL
jgi:cytochrome c peroxidase